MKRFTLPNPLGIEFQYWAAQVVDQLAALGVRAPVSEDFWREWAMSLLYAPELAFLPTPDGFPTWQEWATRAIETT